MFLASAGHSRQMLKRVIAVLRRGILCGAALCCPAAQALDELWHFDLVSGSRSLPAPVDLDGDGYAEVLATTRFDGTVWTLGQDGTVRSQYRRGQWLEGPLAVSEPVDGRSRLFALQESTGLLNLVDFHTDLNLTLEIPGEPRIGTMPCFADLNRSGRQELVIARRNGVLTAVDRRLAVLWQYNAGSPFDSSPVVAPVFMNAAVVCAQSVDGVVHGVHGDGTPLWRFAMPNPAPAFPQMGDLLVVELQSGSPVVLAGDREGWLYAIDAISGREHWRVRAGTTALGSPAIADVHEAPGREVITVSAAGEVCILSSGGKVLVHVGLPEAVYIPRPLVADVDGDGAYEIIVPAREWRIVTASLSGDVKEEIALRGNAREGVVLADGNRDGLLELYAVTDSARAYCLSTHAREGWTHPRGGPSFGGFVPPISQAYEQVHPLGKERAPRRLRVTIPEINRGNPFAVAVVDMGGPRKQERVAAVLRQHDRVLGSSVAVEADGRILIPYWRDNPAPLTLDLLITSPSGELRAHYGKVPVEVSPAKPVLLPSRDEFATALGALGGRYAVPESWRLPKVAGRDTWTVATYMPETWKAFGIADEAFIREAVPRIDAPANKRVFGLAHPAWVDVRDTKTPFFLMNGYFQPAGRYSEEAYAAILDMAGDRFLGFPVHEWAYRVWKEELESGKAAPKNRKEATALLKADFERLMYETHGRIYAGEGYCMTQHQAYAWGAPICYAELGENIPCAPLQFAFLRGAARQYGNKPWGAYISNWFRGSVLDSRLQPPGAAPIRWSPPEDSAGPECGRSASLEFRLAMAAHLAGATFVHHESDAFHDSVFVKEESKGQYTLSAHGQAMKQWFDFAQAQSERGVPYTPIAFVIDFDHGWRPREPIYGIWPQDTATVSLEKMFRHVFAWDG
ncbi:MAG: PQQ-binding-like beta-propeller repeat protein, partial [Candidatus Hydrogenedentes bacterium]|nr:PQQ-binding-like beta-propeller repeat protein [Candidatus Hydrogenedentota bacterium]